MHAFDQVLVFALCGISGLEQSTRAARHALERLRATCVELPAIRSRRVAVVDGSRVFARPGPLLLSSAQVLSEILHPELQPYGHEGVLWQYL